MEEEREEERKVGKERGRRNELWKKQSQEVRKERR